MANRETSTQGANMSKDFEHAQRIIKSQSESIENLIKTVNTYIEICDMRQKMIEVLQAENNRCASAMEEVYELREKVHSYKDSINSLSALADRVEKDLVKSEKDKRDLLTQTKVLNNLIEMLNNTIEALKYEQKFKASPDDVRMINEDLERSAKEISSLKSLNTKYKETIADLDNRLGLKYPTIV
jgi:chromosome segregation ATPase